jgi:hypothetical protein
MTDRYRFQLHAFLEPFFLRRRPSASGFSRHFACIVQMIPDCIASTHEDSSDQSADYARDAVKQGEAKRHESMDVHEHATYAAIAQSHPEWPTLPLAEALQQVV